MQRSRMGQDKQTVGLTPYRYIEYRYIDYRYTEYRYIEYRYIEYRYIDPVAYYPSSVRTSSVCATCYIRIRSVLSSLQIIMQF